MRASVVLGVLMLVCSVALASSGDRVALVIGNAAYQNGALRTPANSAADMSAKLKSLGFEVVSGTDLDRYTMFRKVKEFRLALKPGGVGLFFFAGHSVDLGDRNYLLPVDNAVIRTVEDVEIYGFDVGRLLSGMESAGTRLNVVILDASHDNAVPAGVRFKRHRLGRMDVQPGTLIAYATSRGAVAVESQWGSSLYTQVLLKHLGEPGLEVSELFYRVGQEVSTITRGGQVPWVLASSVPKVKLASEEGVARPVEAVPSGEGELRIDVGPANATVWLDGTLLGVGSRQVRWASGRTVLVRAEAAGFEALEERVLVQGGQVVEVVLRLRSEGHDAPHGLDTAPPTSNPRRR